MHSIKGTSSSAPDGDETWDLDRGSYVAFHTVLRLQPFLVATITILSFNSHPYPQLALPLPWSLLSFLEDMGTRADISRHQTAKNQFQIAITIRVIPVSSLWIDIIQESIITGVIVSTSKIKWFLKWNCGSFNPIMLYQCRNRFSRDKGLQPEIEKTNKRIMYKSTM